MSALNKSFSTSFHLKCLGVVLCITLKKAKVKVIKIHWEAKVVELVEVVAPAIVFIHKG